MMARATTADVAHQLSLGQPAARTPTKPYWLESPHIYMNRTMSSQYKVSYLVSRWLDLFRSSWARISRTKTWRSEEEQTGSWDEGASPAY